MAFNRPTLSELIDRIRTDFETNLSTVGRVLRNSVIYVFAKVIAGVVHLLHGHIEWASKQIFPSTADTDNLERQAAIWGLTRTSATFSEGEVEFSGTNGTDIPEGTVLLRSDGLEYKTTEDATISGGVAVVNVVATASGSDSNTDSAVELTLQSSIVGVNDNAVVETAGIVGGADEETDEELRARLLLRISAPSKGGTAQDYETWAKEVSGVTRAWCYPLYLGVGTVATFFVRDNDSGSIFPSSAEVLEVSGYIEEKRPVTAQSYVFAPTGDPLAFEISITPDTAAIRSAVELELMDMIDRDAEPGGTIYLSRIQEAISLAEGEFDHELIAPVTNFVSASGYMATFDDVTWS